MKLEDVLKTMDEMRATLLERGATYGDNYNMMGVVMKALYPDGITLKTEDDFIRWHWVDWTVGKLTRWVKTGMNHEDSIKDAAVYVTFLAAFNREKNNELAPGRAVDQGVLQKRQDGGR